MSLEKVLSKIQSFKNGVERQCLQTEIRFLERELDFHIGVPLKILSTEDLVVVKHQLIDARSFAELRKKKMNKLVSRKAYRPGKRERKDGVVQEREEVKEKEKETGEVKNLQSLDRLEENPKFESIFPFQPYGEFGQPVVSCSKRTEISYLEVEQTLKKRPYCENVVFAGIFSDKYEDLVEDLSYVIPSTDDHTETVRGLIYDGTGDVFKYPLKIGDTNKLFRNPLDYKKLISKDSNIEVTRETNRSSSSTSRLGISKDVEIQEEIDNDVEKPFSSQMSGFERYSLLHADSDDDEEDD